ncbi:AraC family transcriptional regulator [Marinospirillum sp. MEB164]|uniref:AraC family transcriptional regulator n=1 Tax=Marinospirillum alkalitolerans TaxID=3123374 RepID=A0ABW8PY87_9GAMM
MSHTSDWPLPEGSLRYLVPPRLVADLAQHPLTQELYPLAFGFYQRARGHQMQRQQHQTELLIYCIEGEGQVTSGGQTSRVEAGELLYLPAGEPHHYATLEQHPWTIYWVHFSGSLAPALRQHLGFAGTQRTRWIGRQARLLVDFNGLLAAQQRGFHKETLIHASQRLRQLLCALPLIQPQDQQQAKLDLPALEQLMRAHLDQRLDLDTLAAKAGLSRYHFVHRYKALTGVTPIQHYLQMKIEKACQLLDTSSASWRQIAEQLGYEDSYYCSRLFKKIMGISPHFYRRRAQKN